MTGTEALRNIRKHLLAPVHIAPLATFRVLFGAMMLLGILRFALNGWIYDLYIKPSFYFSYYGFEWVKPLGATGMYLIFAAMGIGALGLMLGLFYRISAIAFFILFTYVELIDKTNYLNHYYLVSIVAFLLIFLPAGRYFSLDALRNAQKKISHIPRFFILVLQLQVGLVYFFAGLAKLNPDWLIEAMPLRIWLQPHTDLPLIGTLMDKVWLAYLFSWFAAFYDLSIPFFLCFKKTRGIAYFFVVVFHMLTWLLFPIGLFPFVMILSTLIFFSENFHLRMLNFFKNAFAKMKRTETETVTKQYVTASGIKMFFLVFFFAHFALQLMLPNRYLLYPGNLFWTEQGYRFSWRVMLMEKAGKTFFYVTDPGSGRSTEVMAADHLTPNQEKMMGTQPDMILQFAHYLKEKYKSLGIPDPEVRVASYVSLNGSGSRLFIDPSVDLGREKESFQAKKWILPFETR